jgi:cation transport ATPase
LQALTILPGRVRFKYPQLYYDQSLAKYLHVHLNNLAGVYYSKVNPYSATILVVYDSEKTNHTLIRELVSQAAAKAAKNGCGDLQKYDDYFRVMGKKNSARNRLLFYGLLYLLLKIKFPAYGKFSVSRNVRIVQIAALVTIVAGYPLLKSLYQWLTRKVPADSDLLINLTAGVLTVLRESTEGLMVLVLKALNDYLKFSADATSYRLLSQCRPDLALPAQTGQFSNNFKLYADVARFSHQITPVGLGLATINYVLSGNLANALAILLVLCPSGAGMAYSTGLEQYLMKLQKYKIYLTNPQAIEQVIKVNQVVIDQKELPLGGSQESNRRLAEELKKLGITNVTLLPGKNKAKARQLATGDTVLMVGDGEGASLAKRKRDVSVSFAHSTCDKVWNKADCIILDQDVLRLADLLFISRQSYGLIRQSVNFAKYHSIIWGMMAFFQPLDLFRAKSLNTINSVIVLLLNQRIGLLPPGPGGE